MSLTTKNVEMGTFSNDTLANNTFENNKQYTSTTNLNIRDYIENTDTDNTTYTNKSYTFPSKEALEKTVTADKVIKFHFIFSRSRLHANLDSSIVQKATTGAITLLANRTVTEKEFYKITNQAVDKNAQHSIRRRHDTIRQPEKKFNGYIRTPLQTLLLRTAQHTPLHTMQDIRKE